MGGAPRGSHVRDAICVPHNACCIGWLRLHASNRREDGGVTAGVQEHRGLEISESFPQIRGIVDRIELRFDKWEVDLGTVQLEHERRTSVLEAGRRDR